MDNAVLMVIAFSSDASLLFLLESPFFPMKILESLSCGVCNN